MASCNASYLPEKAGGEREEEVLGDAFFLDGGIIQILYILGFYF
jgi:hypothetical protein